MFIIRKSGINFEVECKNKIFITTIKHINIIKNLKNIHVIYNYLKKHCAEKIESNNDLANKQDINETINNILEMLK